MTVNEKGDSVRGKLLAAALALFNNKGYAATSVREIVQTAGVTKPVLYYYFGSKEGIYLELMHSSLAEFDASLARMTTISGTAAERIVHFCSVILDLIIDRLEVLRLIYAIYYGPPQEAPPINFDEYYSRIVSTVEALVEEGISRGELAVDDTYTAAWIIVSILSTTMEEQICHTPPRIDARLMERMLGVVLQGFQQKANRNEPLYEKEMKI
ncbi:TetR/AcrR family transcriptional regulator [Geotalea sp. SG265]|uniref:TetR/AcrR family transcriptional regulator n=1 Tax=Geotalea sp. SG265 TaxID=2922867 RepID=UPI001FAFBAF0|nr:TetR/AcrR family transcriptional regulator [Geotalea sp. SG265]